MAKLRPDSGARRRGFSLVETTVALGLVSTILLTGLTLLTLQPRLQDSTHAGEDAMRAMEAALESIRSGQIPLVSGQLEPAIAYPVVDPGRDLRMTLEVEPLTTPGLYELTINATYLTWGRTANRQIITMAWRP